MYNKSKRQGGNIGIVLLAFMAFWFIGAYMGINPYAKQDKTTGNLEVNLLGLSEKDQARLDKSGTCVDAVNLIQPDPNETEERSLLLRECME